MSVIKHKEQRVGVFIDAQNLYHSAKNIYHSKVNFGQIVKDDRVAFPQEQTDRSFWTSTPWVSGGNAWLIGFDVGHGYPGDQWSPYWVRCVR